MGNDKKDQAIISIVVPNELKIDLDKLAAEKRLPLSSFCRMKLAEMVDGLKNE